MEKYPADKQALLQKAIMARSHAYAPYSGFKVGAALKGKSGNIYRGANVENASLGLTVCAERSALFSAVSAGEKEFSAMAVVTDISPPAQPCGACLQVINELAGDIPLLCFNLQEEQMLVFLSQLLPYPFST